MLVAHRQQSGIVTLHQEGDGAGLRRALKQIDERLRLWPPDATCRYWRVMLHVADDRPAEHVLTWMDAGQRPLPLSSALLDEVNRHRTDRPGTPMLTVDEVNRQRLQRNQRDRDLKLEQIHDEHRARLERGQTQVSLAAVGKPRYWRRENARPSL